MHEKPTHLDLYAGIGGFAIAAEWAGFRTIAFCEIDPYCRAVLAKHWPGVRQIEDVRDVYRFASEYPACKLCDEPFCERHGEHFSDCSCIGCTEWDDEIGAIDLLTAGVPCQPASLIGKRLGTADERWLWPETLRIVERLRPRVARFENPRAILTLDGGRAFHGIVSQLASIGYDLWWEPIPAYAVGAGHRRERIIIFASDSDCTRLEGHAGNGAAGRGQEKNGSITAPDLRARKFTSPEWYHQSGIKPVVDGIPGWLARHQLSAIGNAIVPEVAFQTLRVL